MTAVLERATGFPPGVVHGFATRNGGVSEGGYGSLNVGLKWGDAAERVGENLRRIAEAGGYEGRRLVRARQVHGNAVAHVGDIDAHTEADAVWARASDGPVICAVTTADCVPVLLVDEARRACAAVHSGWRGTVAGVVPRTVEVLRGAGIDPSTLRVAVGPCIELDAFEVGPEVAEQFAPEMVQTEGYAKPHVDLVATVFAQLVRAGVPRDRIERVGRCTHANAGTYFSYRRDGAGSGQQLSFVGLDPAPA